MMGLSSEMDNFTACIMVFSWGNRNTGFCVAAFACVAALACATAPTCVAALACVTEPTCGGGGGTVEGLATRAERRGVVNSDEPPALGFNVLICIFNSKQRFLYIDDLYVISYSERDRASICSVVNVSGNTISNSMIKFPLDASRIMPIPGTTLL